MDVRWRKRLRGLVIATAAVAALALALFAASGPLLTVKAPPPAGGVDCIVVLGGGNWERVPRAVELFRQGVAPRILVTGDGDDRDSVRMLRRAEVPESAILRESRSQSTWENAELSVPVLREAGVRSAVLVTSWYHTRRALACFQRATTDVTFYAVPAGEGSARILWENRYERGRVLSEWAKVFYYWLAYWIPPW